MAASFEGTVTFTGSAPPAVLVWLPDDHGWQPAAPVEIDQRDSLFVPVIAVAPPGATITVRNGDAVVHNVFSLDPAADLGFAPPGAAVSLAVTWPAGRVVRHGCKIHPQMRLWIAALDTAHHAVAAIPAGALTADFRLDGIPADARRLVCWSPRGEQVEVTAEDGNPQIRPLMRQGERIGEWRVQRRP